MRALSTLKDQIIGRCPQIIMKIMLEVCSVDEFQVSLPLSSFLKCCIVNTSLNIIAVRDIVIHILHREETSKLARL
jgi:hypothetical protein